MKVIVCGAGQVGFNIAKHLAGQHNDVTVLEQSAALVRKIGDSLDVQAIQGYASDPDILSRANAIDADMIIAVTSSDEVNMAACQVAHSLFNVPTKIARIRNRGYQKPEWANLFSRDHLPIDVIISPELEVAEAINRRLEVPGTFDMVPFSEGRVRVVGVLLDERCPVVDTPLTQLTELFPDLGIIVMGVVRNGRLFVPRRDDHLMVEDEIYFAVSEENVTRAVEVFGHEEREARRLVVIGGGNVGSFLIEELLSNDPKLNIKLIEQDQRRAEIVADQHPRAVVLCGDALDEDILREANVAEAETVVAVTNGDEVNILTSLLAKRFGAERVITLINKPTYRALTSTLGIDVYVDPRESTVSTILQHIRKGRIRELHSIRNGEAEIIEAEALETSPLVGKSIRQAGMPEGMLVGAIVRDNEVLKPRGDTVIEKNDRIIVFAMEEAIKKVEQLFAVRLEFF